MARQKNIGRSHISGPPKSPVRNMSNHATTPDPNTTTSSFPVTPQKVRQNCDEIVDALNATWNMQLPKLHGGSADQAMSQKPIERRCAARIRFLCFKRIGNLQKMLLDFEDRAKHIFSNWVWKLSQEGGTLPSLPPAESSLRRVVLSSSPKISDAQRIELLKELDKLLEDECKLYKSSEAYERTSHGPQNRHQDRNSNDVQHPSLITTQKRSLSPGETLDYSTDIKRKRSSPIIKPVEKASSERIERLPKNQTPKRQSRLSFNREIKPGNGRPKPQFQVDPRPPLLHIETEAQNIHLPAPKLKDEAEGLTGSTVLPSLVGPSFSSTESTSQPLIFSPPCKTLTSGTNASSFGSNATTVRLSQEFEPTQRTSEFFQSFHETTSDSHHHSILSSSKVKANVLDDLTMYGPFREMKIPCIPLPFRNHYELCRVSGISDEDLQSRVKKTTCNGDNHKVFWDDLRRLAGSQTISSLQRSSAHAWSSATGQFRDNGGRNSVVLSGVLSWKDRSEPGLLNFRLNPLKLERSCRLHRRFGADRFMVVSLPSLVRDIPAYLSTEQRAILHESISTWLARTPHHLVGRTWRCFFVEPEKGKTKAKKGNFKSDISTPGFKIHLFATDGFDFLPTSGSYLAPRGQTCDHHTRMDISDLLNWHIPIEPNIGSTDCKAFQRFSLGLSKTFATVVLKSSSFLHLQDLPDQVVMNDGCARMSQTLAKKIAENLELKYVPSVYQGRIAGAKGLWMVEKGDEAYCGECHRTGDDRLWIEVSDSQLKIKPHPRDASTAEEEQRTFEVLAFSSPARAAYLNVQLMTILHDRWVPKEAFERLLRVDTETYHQSLCDAMDDPLALRLWLQSNQHSTRPPEGIKTTGARPDDPAEQIVLLLESGFEPQSCPSIVDHLRVYLREYMKRYVERLQIKVPLSTFIYCIADPYGVLTLDEVHLGFSEVWRDSETGFADNILHEREVLVGRLPALLPSDIQRRKAVWRPELRHFKDVIVFPTQGDVPLAHLLSGGDYDGDIPWVCWDENLVQPFKNVSPAQHPPSESDCGLISKSRKMRDIFQEPVSRSPATTDFLTFCFAFNLRSSLLGVCTVEHEKVTYHERTLSSEGAVKLAALAGYLVDSSKQGYFLSVSNWYALRRSISGPKALPVPAYKSDAPPRQGVSGHVVDYIKFGVAQKAMDRILEDFNRKWPQTTFYDQDLSKPYKDKSVRANAEAKNNQPALKDILSRLESDVAKVGETWSVLTFKGSGASNDKTFSHMVDRIVWQMHDIRPLEMENELNHRFRAEVNDRFPHWNILRASCLYQKFSRSKLVWYACGDELCRIKAEARMPSRLIMDGIWISYPVDANLVKRLQDKNREHEDEGVSDLDSHEGDSQLMLRLMTNNLAEFEALETEET